MGDLDLAAKVVLREDPGAFLALGCPGMDLTPVRMAPTEHIRLHELMDSLVEVEVRGEGQGFVQFEFAASWKADLPDRAFDYYAMARRNHRPLKLVVVCMKPGDKQATPPDVVVVADRFGSWDVGRFRFRVVRLWELSAITFLATPGLAALAPFAAGACEATVEAAIRVLEQVEPESRRLELEVALAVFAGNVFPVRDWLGRIPMEILMTSPTYQRILLDGERKVLARQLRFRLKGEAERFVDRLPRASEASIHQASDLIASMLSAPELMQALDAVLPES